MKRLITLFCALTALLTCGAQNPACVDRAKEPLVAVLTRQPVTEALFDVQPDTLSVNGPRLTFDKMSYDFGDLKYGSKGSVCVITFVNDGNAPAVITRTTTTCRCIRIESPHKPVKPGQRGEIRITYTPDKDLGWFSKGVHVYSNSVDRHQILFIQGNVVE